MIFPRPLEDKFSLGDMQPYKILDHTADVGIQATGSNQRELFRNAALGLFHIIVELDTVGTKHQYAVSLKAPDSKELFLCWLKELLYRFDRDKILFKNCRFLKLTETELKATIKGEKINEAKHIFLKEVKAVTEHDFSVVKKRGRWQARFILDI